MNNKTADKVVEEDNYEDNEDNEEGNEEDNEEEHFLKQFVYAGKGNVDAMEKLLSTEGGSVLSFSDENGTTPLCLAANKGHVEMCRFLLSHNVPVDPVYGRGQATPLHFAVHHQYFEICKLLVRHGASLMKKDGSDNDALLLASRAGHFDLVAFFLANGSDIETRDSDGCTPLMLASQQFICLDVVFCLIAFDASINSKDNKGNTALHYACKAKCSTIITALVRNGASLTATNDEGKTPYSYVIEPPVGFVGDKKNYRPNFILKKLVPSDATIALANKFGPLLKDPIRKTCVLAIPFMIIWSSFWFGNYLLESSYLAWTLLVPFVLVWLGLVQFFTFTYGANPSPLQMGYYLSGVAVYTAVGLKLFFPFTLDNGEAFLSPFWMFIILADLAVFIYTFARVHFYDPGTLDISRRNRNKVINDLANENCLDKAHICPTCLIRRPLRSKHCANIDRCVAKFDHFCPFVENTIGAKNHKYFVLNILSCLCANIIFLVFSWQYMSYLSPIETYLGLIPQWFRVSPMFVLLILHDAFIIISLSNLAFFQLKTVLLFAKTTNEYIHTSRYSYLKGLPFSPWHKGLFVNIYEFFFVNFDWTKTFEAPTPVWEKPLLARKRKEGIEEV
eukprot:m.129722 g.129722  ORF g.129722 m.129722 type:complete len:619 (-) comp13050_c6_seq2:128-1984(-)